MNDAEVLRVADRCVVLTEEPVQQDDPEGGLIDAAGLVDAGALVFDRILDP
jgi:hypothetical protein